MEDPLIGRILKDAFQIEKMLAEGGMSQVYLASQLSLTRSVALKVLSPQFNDVDFIELFLREARVCSHINHPNVISVLDFGQTDDGIVFLAMELLDGETLGDIVSAKGPLSLAKTIWLLEQIINGVHAAHQQNVIHRDLKPHNIMISRVSGDDTVAKVLDFGISKPLSEDDLKHTRLGAVMGTAGYLSPEQIEGKRDVDTRADIYAIGAILYFCLTGNRPFKGISPEIIMGKQLDSGPIPLNENTDIDPSCFILQPIIDKAMQIDKNHRYDDVKAMWSDIQSVVSSINQEKESFQQDKNLLNGDVTRYQYCFSGKAKDDSNKEQAISQVCSALKISQKSQRVLMTGKRVIIKKNVSKKTVERISKIFDQNGLLGNIEEMPTATRIITSRDASMAELSMPLPITMEPVTLGDIQAVVHTKTIDEPQESLHPSTHKPSINPSLHRAANHASSRRKKKLCLVLGVCITTIILGAWLIKPFHYQLHDFWVHSIQGKTNARGVSDDEILIGMSAAFSGSAKELGRSMQNGVETLFKAVNATGGIHGRKLQLIAKNDKYEPALALDNIEAFLKPDSGVLALLGNVGTPTAKAILPTVLENNTVMFGTFSGASLLRNNPPDRYVFNYRASYAEETEAIVHYFVNSKNVSADKIAVFYQDDSFGLDGLTGVEKALSVYHTDKEKLITASYTRNTSQVSEAVLTFTQNIETIEAVIIVGTYSASAAFTRAIKNAGYQGEIANVSFVGARALTELLLELGPDYAEKVLITQVVPLYDSYATGVLKYRKDLQTYYPNEDPDFISLEGYISATIFVEGLLRSGRYFTEEELVNKLESINELDLGIGTIVSFGVSNHQASHRIWGVTINPDGSFSDIELE